MSASGYTPILIYASGTTTNVPLAANMTSSASGAELAINYADGKLFYKDSGGVVQVLATKGAGTIGGSNTQVQYNSSGALAGSANFTFDGTNISLAGGTANGVAYLNGSKVLTTGSALVFDGTNLGLGVTPSTGTRKVFQIDCGGIAGYVTGSNGTIVLANNVVYNSGDKYIANGYATFYSQGNSGQHQWWNAPSGTAGNAITFTQAMTLDASGNLLVGTTNSASTTGGIVIIPGNLQNTSLGISHASGASSGNFYIGFGYSTNNIGSITQNGTTGVLYNLTSDYRLKNDQQPLTGAKDFIMALKPKKWQWWDGSGEGVGFVAHEFMEVAKYSGHGEKDAVDADGKPVYQSIQPSSSEVMANLVSFIQEQQSIIESLTARVAQLESK
jgi:hypothetical protein